MIFVRTGRIWKNCIQLYLQPHVVLKEKIFLVLVQTCHSLVLAGIICCNWITGFWRMTDALFIDGLYSELVCLSFSKTQDRVSAGFHGLVIAWDPILWPSNTPEMKHSPWSFFVVFPQHDFCSKMINIQTFQYSIPGLDFLRYHWALPKKESSSLYLHHGISRWVGIQVHQLFLLQHL